MQITNSLPAIRPAVTAATAQTQAASTPVEAAPAESFTRASEALPTLYARDASSRKLGAQVALGLTGAIAGGALAAAGGAFGGVPGALAGAAALAIPSAAVGFLAGGTAANLLGKTGTTEVLGGAVWGMLGGGAAGIAGGAILGSVFSGSGAAIALGVVGAVTGGLAAASLAD